MMKQGVLTLLVMVSAAAAAAPASYLFSIKREGESLQTCRDQQSALQEAVLSSFPARVSRYQVQSTCLSSARPTDDDTTLSYSVIVEAENASAEADLEAGLLRIQGQVVDGVKVRFAPVDTYQSVESLQIGKLTGDVMITVLSAPVPARTFESYSAYLESAGAVHDAMSANEIDAVWSYFGSLVSSPVLTALQTNLAAADALLYQDSPSALLREEGQAPLPKRIELRVCRIQRCAR